MKNLVLILFSLLPLSSGIAEVHPRFSIRYLCTEADAIVIGTVVEGDTAHIERWIRPHSTSSPLPDTITIRALSHHVKKIDWHLGDTPSSQDLPLRRFVAFLKGSGESWSSLHTIARAPGDPECGSTGLFWILDGACYAYSQWSAPGPYNLYPVQTLSKFSTGSTVMDDLEPISTEALLLAEIEAGLSDMAAWKEVLAEPDSRKKASRLASYYLPRTSPAGERKTFLFSIEDQIAPLGDDAVAAIVKTLETRQPGDDISEILSTLRRLPANTEAAIPELSELLGAPFARPPIYVMECLGHTESPLIVPAVWPFLFSPYPDVSDSALRTLARIVAKPPSPAEIAKKAPFVATVRLFAPRPNTTPDRDPALAPVAVAVLVENLKGTLPKRFLVEVAFEPDEEYKSTFFRGGASMVLLHQNKEGNFVLASADSIFSYDPSSKRVSWPREHSLPIEKIQAAISASPSDLSPAGS